MNNRENAWTPDDVAHLREWRREGIQIGVIADRLGRSTNAVKAKMKRVRLQGKCRLFWDDKEDKVLLTALAVGMTYDDIAERNLIPGRTIAGMKARAAKLDSGQAYDPQTCCAKFDRQLTEEEYISNARRGSEKLLAAYQRYFRKYHPASDVARMAA